jgi:putative nucleotidyltransferase with HDIG domain
MRPIGKVLIAVGQLKIGMYVSELDRPWIGTPFLFQGFRINTLEEIDTLRQYCSGVYVDVEKSVMPRAAAAGPGSATRPAQGSRVYKMSASFEEEVKSANEIRASAQGAIDQVFEDVASGNLIDLVGVKRVVHNLVDGVLRNPDAHVCLTQLKSWDRYTAEHSVNVCVLSLALARHMGLPRDEIEMLGAGALLHDIGKLKTPLELLNKPGRLTADEFEIMKSHPVHGRLLLERYYKLPHRVSEVAFSHHERVSGRGYPRGLDGQSIPFWSKIVAIVDVYDAITSDRSYHRGIPSTEALTKMYGWRLTDFDAELLEQFIQCLGIYPVGTLVELTSGEVGIVISVNPEARLRPKVDLVLDRDRKPLYPSRIVNLADTEWGQVDSGCAIQRVLQPGAYGIDLKQHLVPIQQAKLKVSQQA